MPRAPRTRLRALRGSILVIAAALLVAACGEGDGPGGTPTLSKRAYIGEANDLQAEAATVFAPLDGRLAVTPATAAGQVEAFERLIAGYERLAPPRTWADEHQRMVEALRTMRQAVEVISRASARNRAAIATQVTRYREAQREFERAVRDINSSR